MGLSINQNIMAMNSYRNLSLTQTSLSKSLEKLSSGFRINRAADDAAGLAISEGLRSQVGGNKQAVRNAQDGISVVQTAEGALNEVHSILQRMRDLCVQGANDSNDAKARDNIKTELKQLDEELDRIGKVTNFNGTKLLDGTKTCPAGKEGKAEDKRLQFQVGANGGDWDSGKNDRISVDLGEANITNLATMLEVKEATVTPAPPGPPGGSPQVTPPKVNKLDDIDKLSDFKPAAKDTKGGISVDTHANAQQSIENIDKGIQFVSTARANLGAVQNRFEHTINNLNVAVENLSASESRIRDTDMAQEMMQFTRNQILSQAGTAMLAQANQVPQGVLSLLR